MAKQKRPRSMFVLDTNVLMHDPASIYRFEEHDVFIPAAVLDELDCAKKGMSEVSRNVRQVSRSLAAMIGGIGLPEIVAGIPLHSAAQNGAARGTRSTGRLYLQTGTLDSEVPVVANTSADNAILNVTVALRRLYPQHQIVLVSKDINLRIKATVAGIAAEDYESDQVLDDIDLLYAGTLRLDADFWADVAADIQSWREQDRTLYRIQVNDLENWYPGLCVRVSGDPDLEALVRRVDPPNDVILELVTDYRHVRHNVWGITARNLEQNFALNLLLDPEFDFVTLEGAAGTGKTLLALAAGLSQVLDRSTYREIIITRNTVPIGEDIGFLPGTEEEKMTPWMGALMDNLEVLTQGDSGDRWSRSATNDLLRNRVRIHSMNFMRGRTFLRKYIILDEAQNLTAKQMKTLVTRAGPGTKVVCLGNLGQIDTPYLTETSTGLTYAVERFRPWEHAGHITLVAGERSRLAGFANDSL